MFDFIKNISSTELIILVIILVVLFGAKAMMKIGRTSGQAVKGLKDVRNEFNEALKDDKSSNN